MVIIMLSIFLSSVVINISRKGEALEPVPDWLKTVSVIIVCLIAAYGVFYSSNILSIQIIHTTVSRFIIATVKYSDSLALDR